MLYRFLRHRATHHASGELASPHRTHSYQRLLSAVAAPRWPFRKASEDLPSSSKDKDESWWWAAMWKRHGGGEGRALGGALSCLVLLGIFVLLRPSLPASLRGPSTPWAQATGSREGLELKLVQVVHR